MTELTHIEPIHAYIIALVMALCTMSLAIIAMAISDKRQDEITITKPELALTYQILLFPIKIVLSIALFREITRPIWPLIDIGKQPDAPRWVFLFIMNLLTINIYWLALYFIIQIGIEIFNINQL